MKHPSFSIVVPTYQRREMVCEAIRALGRLEYSGMIEVIVVVDGSTDGTAHALAQIECPFPIRIIEQENRGLAAARNRGAAAARSDIILFLDDDMICDPKMIEEHARMYREGAEAVIGDIPLHPDSPAGFLTETVATAAVWQRSTPPEAFDVCGGQLSIAKRLFEALNGFDEEFCSDGKYGDEDVEFAARLVERYDVRHNRRAISSQMNLVTAKDFMRRSRHLAVADVRLISKHPQLTRGLFERRGAYWRRTRAIYWPLSAIPLLPNLLAAIAVRISDVALANHFGSSRLIAEFFIGARWISYWAELRKQVGTRSARRLLRS